jgi:hypothetical protein
MTSNKGPINVKKKTRDRFNNFRDFHNLKNKAKLTQEDYINYLLDLYKEKYPEIKKIMEGE